jgi:hypothetical protein
LVIANADAVEKLLFLTKLMNRMGTLRASQSALFAGTPPRERYETTLPTSALEDGTSLTFLTKGRIELITGCVAVIAARKELCAEAI